MATLKLDPERRVDLLEMVKVLTGQDTSHINERQQFTDSYKINHVQEDPKKVTLIQKLTLEKPRKRVQVMDEEEEKKE